MPKDPLICQFGGTNRCAAQRRQQKLSPLRFIGFVIFIVCGANGCGNKPAAPAPAVVQVVTVSPQDVPIYKEWVGSLDGYVNAQIRAQVTGYLLAQNYVEGSEVKKGDLLFEIDPRPFQASLDQARGKLAQDEAQYGKTQLDVKRYKPLAGQNAISQEELDNAVQADLSAEAAVKADQAAVETASLNLGFTRIIAPIDGIAGLAQAQIGDLVGPASGILTTISTINPIKVYFSVSEQAYLAYRRQYASPAERATHEQGLELQLILADGVAYPLPGKFYFAGREVNSTTGTLLVAGLFPNPDSILRPGQFARVRAKTEVRTGVLVVPQRAVSELQGSYQVAVVDNQTNVHIQPVTVGVQVGSNWIIEKGLHPGDRVIAEGILKVREGLRVDPQPYIAQTPTNSLASNQPGSK